MHSEDDSCWLYTLVINAVLNVLLFYRYANPLACQKKKTSSFRIPFNLLTTVFPTTFDYIKLCAIRIQNGMALTWNSLRKTYSIFTCIQTHRRCICPNSKYPSSPCWLSDVYSDMSVPKCIPHRMCRNALRQGVTGLSEMPKNAETLRLFSVFYTLHFCWNNNKCLIQLNFDLNHARKMQMIFVCVQYLNRYDWNLYE